MKKYDVIIVGAGPGGIFSAYELVTTAPDCKVAVFEAGYALERRKCPIDGDKVKSCIGCKTCSIMSGFGGAGAFSDGKYNITNDFGGTLFEYIGKQKAVELMQYVDKINMKYGGEGTKLYSTAGSGFKKLCLQNKLNLLDASVRHLGTDINFTVLENLYAYLKDKVDFYFETPVQHIEVREDGKANCLTTVQKDSLVCTPVRVGHYGKGGQGQRIYSVVGKSVTLSANGGGQGAKTGLYKIDLPDGDYVIRKLTPIEAERLQTLPDNYTAGISNTQRYKCIGNGWTVDVIAHILGGLHNA